MCGIAGVVGRVAPDEARRAVERINESQSRRGPDDCGIASWPAAVLGHRRLSIFDLSEAGRQPMTSADGKAAITFNGAIYNFRELRREMESAGVRFRTETDTEVLVEGFRLWGLEKLLERIRGMYAFGLWDVEERKLHLVRDRLGVKPLAYAERDGSLAFASSVSALAAAGFTGEIDPASIAEYLEFGYVTDQRAIFEGVRKVPAGCRVEWSEAGLQERTYWTPPKPDEEPAISFDEAVERTEELLLQAVDRRSFADVPVASLLSAGVDSTLVCWAIAKLGHDITTYTVGVPGDEWDESDEARATARQLGVRHEVLDATGEDFPGPGDLASAYGEPFACASALGMLRLSKVIKPSATVLLTGDGGDDVFLGYPEHGRFWTAQRIAGSTPRWAASCWPAIRALTPQVGQLKRASHFLDYTTGGVGAVAQIHEGLPLYRRDGLFAERLADASVRHRDLPRSFDSARRLLDEFLEYDREGRFVGEYLTKVDGATMHYALEARSPFLDQDLWEFAAALPYSTRLRGGTLKAVLREIVARRVSKRVAAGKKRGFGVPVGRWIADRWSGALAERLRDSKLASDGWIDAKAALALLERSRRRGEAPNRLWYIYALEEWLRAR